jgi:hypothetical protein
VVRRLWISACAKLYSHDHSPVFSFAFDPLHLAKG